jgi:hypothetical protein
MSDESISTFKSNFDTENVFKALFFDINDLGCLKSDTGR